MAQTHYIYKHFIPYIHYGSVLLTW